MKTLREHLLDRDRAAEPGLEAMRAVVLATVATERDRASRGEGRARGGFTPLAVLRTLWRELVQPCGGTWATLAAAWVAVLALNAVNEAATAAEPRLPAGQVAAMYALWSEQRRMLAGLSAGELGHRAGAAPDPAPMPAHQPEAEAPGPLGRSTVAPTARGVWV